LLVYLEGNGAKYLRGRLSRGKRIMKEIPLGGGLNAKVDDEDLEDELLN